MFLLCRSKPHPGGKKPSQGEDLAILSLCNHSIIGVRQFRQAEGQEGDEVGCMCSLSVLVVNSGILGYTGFFFLRWYPPKKFKYGKPRLGESTST